MRTTRHTSRDFHRPNGEMGGGVRHSSPAHLLVLSLMTLALLAGCANTAHNQPPTATCTPSATATPSAAASCPPTVSPTPTASPTATPSSAAASMQLVENYIHGKAPTILARIQAQAGVTVETSHAINGHVVLAAGGLAELTAIEHAPDGQEGAPFLIVSLNASPAALKRSVDSAYFIEIYLGYGTASFSGTDHSILYFAALDAAGQPIRARDGSYAVLAFDNGPNTIPCGLLCTHPRSFTIDGSPVAIIANDAIHDPGITDLTGNTTSEGQTIAALAPYIGAKVMLPVGVPHNTTVYPQAKIDTSLRLIEAYQHYNQSQDASAFAPFGVPTGNVALWSLPLASIWILS